MIIVLIVDDEFYFVQYLKVQFVQVWFDFDIVWMVVNGVEVVEVIVDFEFDVVFFDIQMLGLIGLEVVQGIEGSMCVVFVMVYDQYVIDVFEVCVVDYLFKFIKVDWLVCCVECLCVDVLVVFSVESVEGVLVEIFKCLLFVVVVVI